jgi:hypothetical protein
MRRDTESFPVFSDCAVRRRRSMMALVAAAVATRCRGNSLVIRDCVFEPSDGRDVALVYMLII